MQEYKYKINVLEQIIDLFFENVIDKLRAEGQIPYAITNSRQDELRCDTYHHLKRYYNVLSKDLVYKIIFNKISMVYKKDFSADILKDIFDNTDIEKLIMSFKTHCRISNYNR